MLPLFVILSGSPSPRSFGVGGRSVVRWAVLRFPLPLSGSRPAVYLRRETQTNMCYKDKAALITLPGQLLFSVLPCLPSAWC
uniref:Uncharacterized protein n=1 Tax=Varanus komodoensis TaxID=61221 RepID=A0A8D2JHT0_VARKO